MGRWIGTIVLAAAMAPSWGCATVRAALGRSTTPAPSCAPGPLGLGRESRIPRCCLHSSPGLETAIRSSAWRLTKSCASGPGRISDIFPGPVPRSDRARSSAGEPGCRRAAGNGHHAFSSVDVDRSAATRKIRRIKASQQAVERKAILEFSPRLRAAHGRKPAMSSASTLTPSRKPLGPVAWVGQVCRREPGLCRRRDASAAPRRRAG